MEENTDELKPIIRSILLALGRRATEREFRSEYFNTEGESINTILQNLQMSFMDFLKTMPDVCRVYEMNGVIQIERVSTIESAHMDHMTAAIKKGRKSEMPPRFRRLPPRPLHMWSADANRVPSSAAYRVPSSTANKWPPSAANHGRSIMGAPHHTTNRVLQPSNAVRILRQGPPPTRPPSLPVRPVSAPPIQRKRYTGYTIPKPTNTNVLAPHMTMPTIVYKGKSDDETTQKDATINGRHSKPTLKKRSDGDESSSDGSSVFSDDGQQYLQLDKNPFDSSSTVEAQQSTIPSEISHFDKLRLEAKYGKAWKQDPQLVPSLPSYNPFAVELAQHAQLVQQHAEQHIQQHDKITTGKNSSSHSDKENNADSSNAQGESKKLSSNRIVNVALGEIIKQTENDSGKKKATFVDRSLNNDRQYKKIVDFLSQYVTRTSVTMPHPKLKESTNKRFFDVQLMEFVSPSLFTFQFDLSGYKSLTEEMNSHYNNLDASESAQLRVERVFPGLAMAASDEANWHRVEIISADDCEAYVLFVDRGCKKRVNLHTLRYLKHSFTTQSRKSARGSLFGIKPNAGDKMWSVAAIMTFMAKTKDQQLLATIKGRTEGVYELSLITDIRKRTRLADFMLNERLCDALDDIDFSMSQTLV